MNPKLKGSRVIDCIPQTGNCPINCIECFYNSAGFYRTKEEPLLPTLEEAEGRIVRVNSGHDSNLQKGMVLKMTRNYKDKFYNTSIPSFDFPGPVVFTANPQEIPIRQIAINNNLMAVRFRITPWNTNDCLKAVGHYVDNGIPVILTFMRFSKIENIPDQFRSDFFQAKNIINIYWCLTIQGYYNILRRFKGTGARTCGTIASSLCTDCRNCELLYDAWKERRR